MISTTQDLRHSSIPGDSKHTATIDHSYDCIKNQKLEPRMSMPPIQSSSQAAGMLVTNFRNEMKSP